jgi:hypothetical protein
MNPATYRLIGEIGRHLIAVGKEVLKWRDAQPGVIAHSHEDEHTALRSPRPVSTDGGQKRVTNG